MKLSQPSHFTDPYLIYDPVRKDALVVDYDQLVTLTGPFNDYDDAQNAMTKMLEQRTSPRYQRLELPSRA
jgi:hypothetical protein